MKSQNNSLINIGVRYISWAVFVGLVWLLVASYTLVFSSTEASFSLAFCIGAIDGVLFGLSSQNTTRILDCYLKLFYWPFAVALFFYSFTFPLLNRGFFGVTFGMGLILGGIHFSWLRWKVRHELKRESQMPS